MSTMDAGSPKLPTFKDFDTNGDGKVNKEDLTNSKIDQEIWNLLKINENSTTEYKSQSEIDQYNNAIAETMNRLEQQKKDTGYNGNRKPMELDMDMSLDSEFDEPLNTEFSANDLKARFSKFKNDAIDEYEKLKNEKIKSFTEAVKQNVDAYQMFKNTGTEMYLNFNKSVKEANKETKIEYMNNILGFLKKDNVKGSLIANFSNEQKVIFTYNKEKQCIQMTFNGQTTDMTDDKLKINLNVIAEKADEIFGYAREVEVSKN